MVRPKKHYGQHFLKDRNIAQKIISSLKLTGYDYLIEVGPGTGFLTDFLLELPVNLILIEKDLEAYEFLIQKYKNQKLTIMHADFLKVNLPELTHHKPMGIIGNFPYNISSQIVFKILEERKFINEVVGMFQSEVAERMVSAHGNKVYGILSVMTQIYYDLKIVFSVPPSVFYPPPKVNSAVIQMLKKKDVPEIDFDLFKDLVKKAFNQRRKTLRNSLKSLNLPNEREWAFFSSKRAEELSPEDFLNLYGIYKKHGGEL